jgi:sortase A
MSRKRKVLSWLLLAAGLLLLISGSREFLPYYFPNEEDVTGQWRDEADRSIERPHTLPRFHQKGEIIARLSIPRLESELFVVEGTGKNELRRGPGHMEGTALPGASDNVIIAGHRDTHFRVLKDIQPGDDIVIDYMGEEMVYRVRDTRVVQKTNTSVLRPTQYPRLTLVTCYPFYYLGKAPRRFIVEAELEQR